MVLLDVDTFLLIEVLVMVEVILIFLGLQLMAAAVAEVMAAPDVRRDVLVIRAVVPLVGDAALAVPVVVVKPREMDAQELPNKEMLEAAIMAVVAGPEDRGAVIMAEEDRV